MRTRTTGVLLLTLVLTAVAARAATVERPNIVLIFTDDQGYSDVGCFGARGFATPRLDRLAAEGSRLTSFYVSASVCSASRAALMTGCYHLRVGVRGVFFPTRADPKKGIAAGPGPNGLHPNEVTLAEVLRARGYATICVGKWHLGDALPFRPLRQGFDEYFGLPYSNDMGWWPGKPKDFKANFPPLPLLDGDRVVETGPDQSTLTRRYTERAVDFIRRHRRTPFFLYLPHTMPHIPLFASERFAGRTERGLFGDVIEEIDWSVGRILDTLDETGLTERTLVIFTSDNGPWLSQGAHGGSARPLRDGKFTDYEGGHREPCIVRWPGRVPAGRVLDGITASIDLLPTLAALTGAQVPTDRKLDGIDLWPYLSGRRDTSPRDTFFYATAAVRRGHWKLFAPGKCKEVQPKGPGRYDHPRLYDLDHDIGETRDVHSEHPDLTAELLALLEAHRRDIRDNARPVGRVQDLQ